MEHPGCAHGPGHSWTLSPDHLWFTRCDTCHWFSVRADYYEVYGDNGDTVWWRECGSCLLKTVTAWAEKIARESSDRGIHEHEWEFASTDGVDDNLVVCLGCGLARARGRD